MVRHSVELARSSVAPFSPPHTSHTSHTAHTTPSKRPNEREIKTEKSKGTDKEEERERSCGREYDSHKSSDTMTPIEFILRHTGLGDISSAYNFSDCQVTIALIY